MWSRGPSARSPRLPGVGCYAFLRHLFSYLPQQSGYHKRLRNLAATISWLIGMLTRDTSLWSDDVWVLDFTPAECACSRETVCRSELAGWAEYGYRASHRRYFWGLRLHMLATLPTDPTLSAPRPGQIIIGHKNYFDAYKGQLDLEGHGGKTPHGVLVRVLQRILRPRG